MTRKRAAPTPRRRLAPKRHTADPTAEWLSQLLDPAVVQLELRTMGLPASLSVRLNTIAAARHTLTQWTHAIASGKALTTHELRAYALAFYGLLPCLAPSDATAPVPSCLLPLEPLHDAVALLHNQCLTQSIASTKHLYGQLQPLSSRNDAGCQRLLECARSTRGIYAGVRTKHVWAIHAAPIDATIGNHQLLFYGARGSAVAAILAHGLRIDTTSDGRHLRYGRGVYLSNSMEDAMTHMGDGVGAGCVFVVQAALGAVHTLVDGPTPQWQSAPDGYDAVRVPGAMTPASSRCIVDGLHMAHGPLVHQETPLMQRHDTYVVYRETQVRLRYVITFQGISDDDDE
ncbi:hypothetical protein SDRG_08216 [Saprolegnia diclina VS20]|uniref:NAD(+) ADP-ribosyltransferase n=1 Tax=Saprolegnia diclina (strain VS20) TaxID=1156394 RepID=T0RPR2_SAPDV|nr:hypothetical protein SDRG_08216 [Saprolegnia diclina VS20]EQC34448.1 hypothetical protein SDRG_08216 [Saprolegnia diclina VS20]|eukprot:XP_008612310.1 hypothetical protein SDRG_08216 [Saprolegnia diclina VS20]